MQAEKPGSGNPAVWPDHVWVMPAARKAGLRTGLLIDSVNATQNPKAPGQAMTGVSDSQPD